MAVALLSILSFRAVAQTPMVLPEVSQRSEVRQTIGYTDISIVYHSPAVNGRKIWGELVPYGQVWRAGANENTTISFTDNVTINGSALAAGTYGLHMIPGEKEWVVIFSKDHTSWGSYFYKESEDALRVKASPAQGDFMESLDYTFTDRKASAANVTMMWEKMKVSFTVGVDVKNIALRHIREQLNNQPGFTWHGWEEAAHYCITNKFNYDEALRWINTSVKMEENFTNVAAKAQLLTLMGKTQEAADEKKKVLKLMEAEGETRVNAFGYELLNEKDVATAVEAFKLNVKKHPDSWNAYDSMADGYNAAGDHKLALANYKLALARAPEEQKERLKKTIASLEKK